MISSRTRRGALLFLAAGLLPAAAQAQPLPPPYPPPGSTAPPHATGASVPQATGAPRTLPGAAQAGPDTAPAKSGRTDKGARIPARPGVLGRSGGSAITVSSLGMVEGPPAGTLDASNGGLGSDLWSGSARGAAEDLMNRLPLATTVSSVRSLARRLVLTRAAAPVGDADQAFTTVRIRRLLHAGLIGDAAALAEEARVPNNPGFARVQAEAVLFAGHKGHVCDDTTATRMDSAEPFWIELRAYCYAVASDSDALTLTRAVMKAQDIDDQAFDTLLDDVENDVSKDPGSIDAPTAVHAFLLRQTGLPVGFDIGAQLGTPGLLLALRSKGNSPEDRMRAAERVYATGAISGTELVRLADAQSFTKDQFATPYAQLDKLPFLAGQAFMRQAVLRAPSDVQPALIFEALRRADMKGRLGIAATLQSDALAKLALQPNLHDMADLFGRALMLSGNTDAATQWLSLFDPRLDSDRALRARLLVVLNLLAADPSRQAAVQGALSDLAQAVDAKVPGQGYAVLALGLYNALGQPLPADARKAAALATAATWPGRRPAPALLSRLHDAIQAKGRKGEALMLSLNAIGRRGPGDVAPDVTVRIVQTLMKLGGPDAARGLAIDALLRYHLVQASRRSVKTP